MADSPTPETGTPESQSPDRTPPALITTEELLQSMTAKGSEAGTSSAETSPGGSTSLFGPSMRYARLRSADAGNKLQALLLPSEEKLRAAALGGRPTVGPPPRLPHQLSPALTAVLLGWRSLYESCRTQSVLQTLVGEGYAPGAVFEDAMVSARGQEAIYRQFAMLGAAVRSVQVGAYSLSVTPLSSPTVTIAGQQPPSPVGKAKGSPELQQQQLEFTPPRRPGQRLAARSRGGPGPAGGGGGSSSGPSGATVGIGAAGAGRQPQAVTGITVLHLTKVAVENVQSYTLATPAWLTWLLGSKGPGLQVDLYVTSILLVVSDSPLAVGLSAGAGGIFNGGGGTAAAADVTARRLAGAAAALGGGPARPEREPEPEPERSSDSAAGVGATPSWRIVHHVDIWHNVPLVWWRLRRVVGVALDTVLSPLLGL